MSFFHFVSGEVYVSASLCLQAALVAAFALALASVASGARGALPTGRLAAAHPAVTRPGLRRGLAVLGLALTPGGQRTRLVVKLQAVGRPGPMAWHGFLATRGAIALGAVAAASCLAAASPAVGLGVLGAGAWAVWRGQERGLDRVRRRA